MFRPAAEYHTTNLQDKGGLQRSLRTKYGLQKTEEEYAHGSAMTRSVLHGPTSSAQGLDSVVSGYRIS